MDNQFLSVRDLVVEYSSDGNRIQAVNGVSFELEKGKTLGLVGETGAGKTTIAKSILRILPDRSAKIQGGEINFCGENLLNLSEKKMREVRGNKIAMIFQDPMTALNPVKKLGDQITEVIKIHNNISEADAVKRAKEMLELVGIPAQRYNEYPHQFSGGMKQRVVIAIALACNPELLLADEPTTGVMQCIRRSKEMMNKQKGNYFLLQLSFIGWYLFLLLLEMFLASAIGYVLASTVYMVLNLALNIYVTATCCAFYMNLKGESPVIVLPKMTNGFDQ